MNPDAVRRLRVWILVIGAVVLLAGTRNVPQSFSDGSRWNTVYNLVQLGTYAQDVQDVFSADVVFVNGHYYSHQPPLQPTITAGIGLVLKHALNLRPTYYLLTLLTNGIALLMMLAASFQIIDHAVADPRQRALFSLGVAVASLAPGYALAMSNHEPAAAFLVMGIAVIHSKRPLLAGVFLGIAASFEPPFPTLFVVFFGAGLLRARQGRDLARLAAGFLFFPIFYIAFNVAISGSSLPFAIRPDLFAYPNSPWSASQLSGVTGPSWAALPGYAAAMLAGPKGFFIYSPLAIIGVLGLKHACTQRDLVRIALIASALVGLAYFVVTTTNLGGQCYGIRWFVSAAMMLYLAGISFLADRWHDRRARIFFAVLLVWSMVAVAGAIKQPYSGADFSFTTLWH